MKKFLLALVCALFTLTLSAQEKDPVLEAYLQENMFRTGMVLDPYEYLPTAETPVPKGYKPFYISHYGRHGSRSDWPADGYRGVYAKFTKAHEAHLLTAEGEKAYEIISDVFHRYDDMGGRLTPLGAQEHRQIAGRLYNRYKKIFRASDCRIRAVSSTSPRCIISMAAFTGELLSRNPKLDVSWDSADKLMSYMSSGETPDLRNDTQGLISANREAHPRDTTTFMKNVFTDPQKARELLGSGKELLDETLIIAIASGAYGCDDSLLRLFNEDDIYWHAQNFCMTMYLRQCNSVEFGDRRMAVPQVAAFVNDFVGKADEVIEKGNYDADLRFGHDTHLLAICSRLGIKGVAERLTAEECPSWPGYLYCPFGANLQAVFYRNKEGDVLVKFYINERETSLISLDGGPYYRWDDVKKTLL